MARLIWIVVALLAGCAWKSVEPPVRETVTPSVREPGAPVRTTNFDKAVIRNSAVAISDGIFHCDAAGSNLGYPSCLKVPAVVLEVTATQANPGACVVILPYKFLIVHHGKRDVAKVNWELIAPKKYFFAESYKDKATGQRNAVDGISLLSAGLVWKKQSNGGGRNFNWDAVDSIVQASYHVAYASWRDANGDVVDCEPFDPVILNEYN